MNTENRINYYFTNIYNWLNPDKDALRNHLVKKLIFDLNFRRKEMEVEQSTYHKDDILDLKNVDHAREFLQHVMERHGASPMKFDNTAMMPETWISNQLLNYVFG